MTRLDRHERAATARSIAGAQRPDGSIPWTAQGAHWDPWDHVECVLALDVGGFHREALAALRHLARTQRHDGAWACPIVGGDPDDKILDSNAAAYLAVGVWHHYLWTDDEHAVNELWPTVARAIDFVLNLQLPGGAIAWARNLSGDPGDHALLAASSSISMSLRCALQVARLVGDVRPDWELALVSLTDAICREDSSFADRSRYSMDWYYPVLTGVVTGDQARVRMSDGWDRFVVGGLGARCVDDRPWITSAETAELSIALTCCDLHDEARALFDWVQYLRAGDGSYWTGATFPDGRHFPNERTTWSAAAILIADAVLRGENPAAELFPSRAVVRR